MNYEVIPLDIYKEILLDYIKTKIDGFSFNELMKSDIGAICMRDIISDRNSIILEEIKEIIQNENLSDEDCFEKVEKIVAVFENHNINTGGRHDF